MQTICKIYSLYFAGGGDLGAKNALQNEKSTRLSWKKADIKDMICNERNYTAIGTLW
jgi:hypothetical protein